MSPVPIDAAPGSAGPAEPLVWTGADRPDLGQRRSVVTIGVFDGVHRGHQVTIRRAVELARAAGVPAVVVTFDPHPVTVVRAGTRVPVLSTVEQRVELLHRAGADAVWVLPFTLELSQLTPEEFVAHVLVARLHPVAVVVGANFRFGHRAQGDTETLDQLGLEHGFAAEAVELAGDPGGPRWSSTAVRAEVAAGQVAAAAQILGRPYRVDGVVVHGDHRGRGLGYPTANLELAADTAVPADGVYSGRLVRAGGDVLPAAVSVGTNPTFDGTQRRVEAYVLDRDDLELYGERVGLELVDRLRPTLRFDSVDELTTQIALDVAAARAQLG
jgi:riboflavin kinase/FMN adenylyltransferase